MISHVGRYSTACQPLSQLHNRAVFLTSVFSQFLSRIERLTATTTMFGLNRFVRLIGDHTLISDCTTLYVMFSHDIHRV